MQLAGMEDRYCYKFFHTKEEGRAEVVKNPGAGKWV